MAIQRPTTLGALRESAYEVLPIREEIRRNLMRLLANKSTLFPGIVGYDQTVMPQLTNALLAGQDIILLGERGQAKSRIIRGITSLLDEYTPILAGTEIPENPFEPLTPQGKAIIKDAGDDAEITWLHRDERYGEKLATPDITIADLIGDVDPIKIAEGRYLSDELTLHYGLVPHSNRGIFAINELPDLSERIQVGLLNVMEERDVQIRNFKVRLPLDVLVVATANPEDYTNRGRIITPLKDRYGAQIRTHYPESIYSEIEVMQAEKVPLPSTEHKIYIPEFIKEIVAEITHEARRSPDINQRSGVSVRTSIANFESVLANAFRRALVLGEDNVVPRISDLPYAMPSFMGKVEFEAMEDGKEEEILMKLIRQAVDNVFSRYYKIAEVESIALPFIEGMTVTTGETKPASEYVELIQSWNGLGEAVERAIAEKSPAAIASAVEFILEGLHLNKLLNKDQLGDETTFRG